MRDMKKLQVFVSSTYEDLKEERQAAIEAILEAGHIPAGMEMFSAGEKSQIEVIREWIEKSDVFLLVLGGRYGSIERLSGKGYIQLEYEYALAQGKPAFAIVIDPTTLEERIRARGSSALELEHREELKQFESNVRSREVKFWRDLKDIKLTIHQTLNEWSRRPDIKGWIRSDQSAVAGSLQDIEDVGTSIVAEDSDRVTRKDLEALSREFQGRLLAMMGMMIGSLHSNPFALEQSDEDKTYLAEAVYHSRQAYLILKELRGAGKYMALNNLVYYLCLLGVNSGLEALLDQARELRDIGLKYGHLPSAAPYVMTYARVIATYGTDPKESREALELVQGLLRNYLTNFQEKEAAFLASSLAVKLYNLQNSQ